MAAHRAKGACLQIPQQTVEGSSDDDELNTTFDIENDDPDTYVPLPKEFILDSSSEEFESTESTGEISDGDSFDEEEATRGPFKRRLPPPSAEDQPPAKKAAPEDSAIVKALEKHKGNVKKAAAFLRRKSL